MQAVLETVVIAIVLGITAQVLAHRFKLPAILPLLLFGMGAGPFGLHFFDPAALGHGLEVFIHLGVAIVLFEGGLSLDLKELRRIGGPLRNLLTLGTAVTAFGGAALAHWLTGVSWSTAALFGAIVTVTGPTVIAPLLRHMIAPPRTRTLLLSEGLMIDPIGAVLAYLVLQWIDRAGLELRPLVMELLELIGTGTVLGFVAGSIAVIAVRNRHLAGELRNLVILALLLGSFVVAEQQAPQSGVLASVVMGLRVSAANVPDMSGVKAFKGQLTVLVISVLFILLSGQLDLGTVEQLGMAGLLVVAGLILVVRPLSVLAAMPFGQPSWREKVLLALTAPRGIVAAAVASLSAIQLRAVGKSDDAGVLEGLVYLVILVTCTWATVLAKVLPKLLGFEGDPERRRVVLVGANGLTTAFAGVLRDHDWKAVVVDSAPQKLARLREQKVATVSGDARDAATYDEAGLERDSLVAALTLNDELNLLVAELVRTEFDVEHPVVALHQPSSEFGSVRRAWIDLLGGRGLDLSRWNRLLGEEKAKLLTIELRDDEASRTAFRALLRERPNGVHVVCTWEEGRPSFDWPPETLAGGEEVTLLAREHLEEEIAAFARPAGSAAAAPAAEADAAPRSEAPQEG